MKADKTAGFSATSAHNNNGNNGSSSCSKCVQVLRDLVAGMQEKSSSSSPLSREEESSKPLQLLRAIAGGNATDVTIENVNDGIKMIIPVKTTSPTLLRRWSAWSQEAQAEEESTNELLASTTRFGERVPKAAALATSAVSTQQQQQVEEPPLTIELKCRKCKSSGPEGGARAFLMGPSPLSVVVCQNRIQPTKREIDEILTHELIHLYDVQTQQLDLQQCENLAYSEVRAAKHAECKDSWKQLQSYCVKQKAICATNNLFPTEGRQCIQTVFRKAFEDNRPFASNEATK